VARYYIVLKVCGELFVPL